MPDLIKNAPTLFGKAAKPKAIPLHGEQSPPLVKFNLFFIYHVQNIVSISYTTV